MLTKRPRQEITGKYTTIKSKETRAVHYRIYLDLRFKTSHFTALESNKIFTEAP